MPQRRDNAGAVCDSDMGTLFLNLQFLSYRRLVHQKNGVEFCQGYFGTIRNSLATSDDIANFRPIRDREIILHTQTHRQRIDIMSGHALRAVPAKTTD